MKIHFEDGQVEVTRTDSSFRLIFDSEFRWDYRERDIDKALGNLLVEDSE